MAHRQRFQIYPCGGADEVARGGFLPFRALVIGGAVYAKWCSYIHFSQLKMRWGRKGTACPAHSGIISEGAYSDRDVEVHFELPGFFFPKTCSLQDGVRKKGHLH